MSNVPKYRWVPGAEIPLDAIERMKNHFRRPPVALEEMANSLERKPYSELIEKPIEEIDRLYLWEVLFEISSCTFSFGQREDWQQWFKYMLPHLILKCTDRSDFKYLSDDVITAFMSIYWNGIPQEYTGFREDVMETLSLQLMNKNLWFEPTNNDSGVGAWRTRFLDSYLNGDKRTVLRWDQSQADEKLSSSMFFCLKYLTIEDIPSWVESLFLIDDIYWKGALMVWLLGAIDVLNKSPVLPKSLEKSNPKLEWNNSFVFSNALDVNEVNKLLPILRFNSKQEFLPAENTTLFLREVRKHLTDELIVEWAELFSTDELVMVSTYSVPESLLDKLSST